jgi:CSLREA domain-containing protein
MTPLRVMAAGLVLFLALAANAAASTVMVNTTIDAVQAGDGACSLREATLYANGTAEPDCAAAPASGTTTIDVPAGLYRLRGQVLTLTGSATLIGAGAATTTIDAAGASQVFFIQDAAHVAISDVTITGGMSGQTTGTNPVFGLPGGGINNNGTLALERVIVTGNRTSPGATSNLCTQIEGGCPGGNGGDGGGIDNAGTLTIADSAITANSTGSGAAGTRGDVGSPVAPGSAGGPGGTSGDGGRGGGIANFQTLTITNSTIAGNTTGNGAPGGDGGSGTRNHIGGNAASGGNGGSGAGILSGGQLVISDSTVSGNEAGAGGTGGTGGNGDSGATGGDGGRGGMGGAGGGIASSADTTITNSTIADNSAGTSGTSGSGGLLFGFTPPPVGGANGGGIDQGAMGATLTHVTITSNRATGTGGGVNGDGGTITVGNSIVASNQAVFHQNCDGVITDQGGNVEFGDASCPTGFLRADPQLSPLGNHGGPTQTVALQPGSAALHHVRTCVLRADQRGVARPVGSACDSGAYEVAPPLVVGVSVSAITNTTAGIAANVNPNLRDATVVVNYGRTPSYGSSTSPVDVGAGNDPSPFSAGLGGLVSGATYHFDIVATNADGQTTTSDGTFTTAPVLAASIAGISTAGPLLSLTIACAGGSGPGTCTGPIALTAHPSGKHRHSVTVATGAYSVPAGQQRTVKVALNRTGRTMLTRDYVLATTISVRGTTPVTRNVTFSYPRITSKTPYAFVFGPRSSIATQLTVIHVPRGGSVTVICHGGACPFAMRRFAPRHGQVVLTRFFRHRQFRPGTTIQLRIAAPNRVAEVETLVIRSGQQPGVTHQCLPPGAARPARCVKNHG